MKILKISLWFLTVMAISSATPLRADGDKPSEQTIQDVTPEYELRVYFGGPFQKESQIVTRVKVGEMFFAKSESPIVYTPEQIYNAPDADRPKVELYVASGTLSAPKDGKFPLDFTFMVWQSPRSSLIYGPNYSNFEFGKFKSFYSGAIVQGYKAILSEVKPSSQDKEK